MTGWTAFASGTLGALVVLGQTLSAGEVEGLRAGTVEVTACRSELLGGPGGDWFVFSAELRVQPAPGNDSRFVDRVSAQLSLGYGVGAEADRSWEFYQAVAHTVTLEQGRSTVRFYLPPEIVRRDRVRAESRFHVLDLTVAGRPQPLERAQLGAGFTRPESLQQFRTRVAAEASRNAGILLLQPQTPFAVSAGGPPAPTLLSAP